jgi:hypothetical protein
MVPGALNFLPQAAPERTADWQNENRHFETAT